MPRSAQLAAALILPILLGAAAPTPASIGKFQTWSAFRRAPLAFSAGGVTVRVEALPCPVPAQGDSTCRWDGYNNQAVVTVTTPAAAPLRLLTDDQASYARIAVVRFAAADRRPGVIVESQSGGSGGDMTAQLLLPEGAGWRVAPLGTDRHERLQGQIADAPADLSGDGRIDLQLEDGHFDSVFGCNACTPRPPRFFAVQGGAVVDESRAPGLRAAFARDMAVQRARCMAPQPDRNGACAAYVADAARAGQFAAAWSVMLAHFDRTERNWQGLPFAARARSFPEALRAFLVRTGYLPA